MTMSKVPVLRVEEYVGPKGGAVHVLVLVCGHWQSRRLHEGKAPPTEIACLLCFIQPQIDARASRRDRAKRL